MPAWLAPLLIGGGLSLFNSLFGKNKQQVVPPQKPTYFSPGQLGIPQYVNGAPNPLYSWMQTGIVPFSDQPTVTTTNASGLSNTKSDTVSQFIQKQKTNPVYDGAEDLLGMVKGLTMDRLRADPKVGTGEQMGVINQIMSDSGDLEKAMVDRLSASGQLGGPAEAGARSSLAAATLAPLAGYRASVPAEERARRIQDEQIGAGILEGLFKGSLTESRGASKSTTNSKTDWSQFSESSTQGPPQFNPSFLNYLIQNPTLINQPGFFDQMQQWLMYMMGAGMFGGSGGKTPAK